MRIEDYAVIGDTETCALVGADGSIDWLCWPRFDSGACFAALLGTPEHGRWKIAPKGELRRVHRRYRGDTFVLETELEGEDGTIRITDFMPVRDNTPNLVRIVEAVRGRPTVELEITIRFDYGSIVPWVTREEGRWHAVAGPDALVLTSEVELHGRGQSTVGTFALEPGQRLCFSLTWHKSCDAPPPARDPMRDLECTCAWWQEWADAAKIDGPYKEPVLRSLLALKALTYAPSGGIVAAATTSLPETLGGSRNWDYRYCWLRDATFTLQALMHAGYTDEARAWREWLIRAVAGEPAKLQILYGVTGERRIDELECTWLPGYEGARPVRIGNAAVSQLQLDVYGELMDALFLARSSGLPDTDDAWSVQRACLEWLEGQWAQPDEGMWEVRGGRRDFTLSKVMAWVAFDRAAKTVEQHRMPGPAERWNALREQIHTEVCRRGFDRARNTFTQAYESPELDANLLLLPIVGFVAGDDPRMIGTIAAIERELVVDGFVQRYRTSHQHVSVDGQVGREGSFLACSFWLVDALVLAGRRAEAVERFERLLTVRNDVGLLSEEYDPIAKRLVGNFPQAFSHVALINSAHNLHNGHGPAHQRAERSGGT